VPSLGLRIKRRCRGSSSPSFRSSSAPMRNQGARLRGARVAVQRDGHALEHCGGLGSGSYRLCSRRDPVGPHLVATFAGRHVYWHWCSPRAGRAALTGRQLKRKPSKSRDLSTPGNHERIAVGILANALQSALAACEFVLRIHQRRRCIRSPHLNSPRSKDAICDNVSVLAWRDYLPEDAEARVAVVASGKSRHRPRGITEQRDGPSSTRLLCRAVRPRASSTARARGSTMCRGAGITPRSK
jgi:hypothetical protein